MKKNCCKNRRQGCIIVPLVSIHINSLVLCYFLPFRSDVLGQVMPLVGKDWTQSGVARLFSAIKVCTFILLHIEVYAN